MNDTYRQQRAGLTMIEMLITLAIISIIAATVFAALDPARRLNTARNTRRWTDITTIVDGLKAYQSGHDGTLCKNPSSGCADITDNDIASVQIIGEVTLTGPQCASYVCASKTVASSNCMVALSDQGTPQESDDIPVVGLPGLKSYLARIPADPRRKGQDAIDDTRYYINYETTTGVITVGACDAESQEAGGQGSPEVIEHTI